MRDNCVPLKLVTILSDGAFHSGEQLGEQLGMSRAAINKHMHMLKEWGLEVFTLTGKGYSLPAPVQLLSEEQINGLLEEGRVAVIPVIDSTNQYLLDNMRDLQP